MKVTLGQFAPIIGDKQANLEKMTEIMEQGAREQADIVLFPELCLTGYFIQDLAEDMSEPIDGESVQYIQSICKELEIYTVFSWPERGGDGKIYNAACLISDTGEIIGNYRKVHLYNREKEIFAPGDKFEVFETELGNIGIMVCYDLDFPESARSLHMLGADIILVPTNNFEPYARYQASYMRVRAMENETPIAICNRVGAEQNLVYFGESAVYDAHGYELITLDAESAALTVNVHTSFEADEKLSYKANRITKAYKQLIE